MQSSSCITGSPASVGALTVEFWFAKHWCTFYLQVPIGYSKSVVVWSGKTSWYIRQLSLAIGLRGGEAIRLAGE